MSVWTTFSFFFFFPNIVTHPVCFLPLCTLPACLFTTCLFVPMRSWQACPVSQGDIKAVWGASKSAGLRDKLHSPRPQLLSLIKPPGWHRERRKRAVRGAGRLGRKKKKANQTRKAHIVCRSALTARPLKLETRQERIDGVHRFIFFIKYAHTNCTF